MLAKAFEVRGYKEKGNYRFKEKKLTAKHYENDKISDAPKIFISQLECQALSLSAQKLINQHYINLLHHLPPDEEIIFTHNPVPELSYKVYEQLRAESEYAAWMYVHGFRANHFTVFVNALDNFSSLERLNDFLTKNGIELNQVGGKIKGSKEQYLKQTSTLADKVMIHFIEGHYNIPACYYEFAERFALPNGKLFQGFITGSADKIFESTHYRK